MSQDAQTSPSAHESDPTGTRLALHVEFDRHISFAMQQNDVPVVKALHLENLGDEPVRDLLLTITSEPEFTTAWSATIDAVPAQSRYNVDAVDLGLSPAILGALTERVRGRLRFTAQRGGEVLLSREEPVDLLARDEWSGGASLPEILAAYVTPNHPALGPILTRAAELLEKWTGDSALSGYQSKNSKRVWSMVAAIYAAILDHGFTYVNPPPSFESAGQRIRLPGRLVEQGMGTCLDMAVFAAAALEACGLHSLVALTQGHAFAGVWLSEDTFPDPACDDALRLRKRVELQHIAVFDPTLATSSDRPSFERAVAAAVDLLHDEENFAYFVDVRRARIGRIRPLPERVEHDGDDTPIESGSAAPRSALVAPDDSHFEAGTAPDPATSDAAAETPQSRLDRWRGRLLDLTLRNRLLNFKQTRKTLPMLCPDLATLEDRIADGQILSILPRPSDLGRGDPRDGEAHRRRTGDDALEQVVREDLDVGRLHTDLADEETRNRLTELYRAARTAQEEGGSSELFLSLGMLAWYQTEQSEDRRVAPLLLLPVTLTRRSVHEGFQLRAADEDPTLNVTLLEMLQQQHGITVQGLDPLPTDESGVDVPAVLRRFREAVVGVNRWEVTGDAWVGLFSFTKFLMWKDLTARAEQLMENGVVDHLVNRPREPFPSSGEFPRADQLDATRRPTDVYCPMSADSSQLAAVMAAADGRSFVLEGPPGTGKSQTITNLIAHCLAEGKQILFVSEKMAALSVVQRRLSEVGLGDFCLELHSNKSSKALVLEQLRHSVESVASQDQRAWEQEAQRLERLRNDLNAYVHALHLERASGESVFQVTSRLIGLRDVPRVPLTWKSPADVNAEQLFELRDNVARLSTAGRNCGDLASHPWRAVQRGEWKPGWEEHCLEEIGSLRTATSSLTETLTGIEQHLDIVGEALSRRACETVAEVCDVLLDCPRPPRALLVEPEWDLVQEQMESWIRHGRVRDALRSDLFEQFTEQVRELDCDTLASQTRIAEASAWPLSWWRRRPVVAALRAVSLSGKAPPRDEFAGILERVASLREEEHLLEDAGERARALLDRHWRDGEADWDGLATIHEWARKFRSLAQQLAGEELARASDLRSRWAQLATEHGDQLAPDQSIGRALLAVRQAHEQLRDAMTRCDGLLELDDELAWGAADENMALSRITGTADGWTRSSTQLRDWCHWRDVRAEAIGLGLRPFVEAYERASFDHDQAGDVFEHGFAHWWLTSVMDSEPLLARFVSSEHVRKIHEFRAVDQRYTDLTRHLIAARLAAKVPRGRNTAKSSETGILARELAKKRRHMPMRKLFSQIPNLLPRLKPCLLMSPISIAQYLDTSFPKFDVVVFDEASQIPVWDAVGAIARGDQLVVVGDPKQLPPTSFFQRSTDEDDLDDDVVEDLESILDDCIGAQVPLIHLDWHYRSRHESLIAFSNHHYYDNNLLTFPAADDEDLGVTWRPVPDGIYDKGKSRTNQAEAEALVDEIKRRLRDPELQQHTIGVVTFSQPQQILIENLLDAARLEDQELERFFSEDLFEPVFIKNLENVQGDERDVILFSICYGPDAQGRVSMNFGPMNRQGGQRRLNVAITRARREVIVFSTLRADQIDLNRTQAQGVQDLKTFLDYAHRGMAAISEATHYRGLEDFDSPFEAQVHKQLTDRGWQVHPQVGCSGYRLDLAIVDPDVPGRYLLGVECDGATYHSAKTARDRDRLRESVLRGLGWEIHRIWSTDWWTDPARELKKVEAALEAAKMARERRGHESEAGGEDSTGVHVAIAAAPTASVASASRGVGHDAPEVTVDCTADPFSTAPAATSSSAPTYRATRARRPSSLPFYEKQAVPMIQRLLAEVVANEAPILLELAARRVGSAYGLGRVSSKAAARVTTILHTWIARGDAPIAAHREVGEAVLWRADDNVETWSGFRVPGNEPDDDRPVHDIPLQELANAVTHALAQNISLPGEDLAREAANLLGVTRMGHKVRSRMEQAIDVVVAQGLAKRDGEMVTVVG